MNTLLEQVGQQQHLYEIFVESTEEIFTQISEAIRNGVQDESFLVDAFNDEYNSSAIITHFRVSDSYHALFILWLADLMVSFLMGRSS